ncbi:tRNA (uridine(34)/cytosine(34)/5-carboxymethylaminomethyluridine(34)-2'-O)-methyltransferase TrmL [Eubacterium barkeri]|uniref:Putative tRNA (cytidine(34)-2'-O)-methyltransferase n=1 Tax=Eubacterium barkeri TaxID=1528 RepID=A0A1H3BTW9_EUBBA|nr:tRNA (uridine(34)/cytosine(34)/5-carboxymethylaminomethyluridine(34)-2'-O)-methyltransferase TrmL [Eubacterium barkeri]SDX45492.1 tRNA (cytidine/uridine-2'-O-)-methyltransferase [Eubacterium barkeri]
MINIVLFQPEIPQNTGNIARTCALTETKLHLIKPLGFSISDKAVKRAGLDYWDLVDLAVYDNFEDFIRTNSQAELYLMTTHGDKHYADIDYPDNAFIMFGRETAGLPESIHSRYPKHRFRIPMKNHPHARSLNLANSVNIVLYEALRQHHYYDLV